MEDYRIDPEAENLRLILATQVACAIIAQPMHGRWDGTEADARNVVNSAFMFADMILKKEDSLR